jgi:outer membrane biosynthesis protein TonB
MPIPEDEMLGPGLERRLKAALDEVVPPSPMLSSARYRMGAVTRLSRAWRFAPALVAIGAAGAVLTATAATGSPNPAIWRDRAGTVLQNVGHFAGSSPKATQSPKQEPRETPDDNVTVPSRPTPSSSQKPAPRQSAEPTDGPEPAPSPEPSESPEPSATPDSSGGSDSSSTPTGGD